MAFNTPSHHWTVQASPPVGRSVIRGQGYLCGAFMFLSQGKCMVGALRWWGERMNEWDQCPQFLILPPVHVEAESFVNKLSVTGNQSLSTGPFPRSSLEQCPLKILEFLPGAVVISLGGFGGLSLPFPLTQPLNENVSRGLLPHPFWVLPAPFPLSLCLLEEPRLGYFPGPDLHSEQRDLIHAWGGAEVVESRGIKKNPLPLSLLENGAVVWGPCPGGQKELALHLFMNGGDLGWIGVWYTVTSVGGGSRKRPFLSLSPFQGVSVDSEALVKWLFCLTEVGSLGRH